MDLYICMYSEKDVRNEGYLLVRKVVGVWVTFSYTYIHICVNIHAYNMNYIVKMCFYKRVLKINVKLAIFLIAILN